MRFLRNFPIALFSLPLQVRLSIIVLSFLVSLSIYWMTFETIKNGTIVVIPIVLAAWLFKYRGAFICVGATWLAIIGVYLLSSSHVDKMIIVVGLLSGLLIALVTSSLRSMVDLVETAKQKIVQAEQQKNLAYTQKIEAMQAEQKMSLAYKQEHHLNELKDQFITNINHELRTPLTVLFGYAELLDRYGNQLDTERRAKMYSKLMYGCQELLSLVDTVLDVSQISSEVRPLQLEALSVEEVVHEVFESLDPYNLQDYQICLDIPDHLIIWANRQSVLQVLRNLLSNAFKYSPKGTTVVISATLRRNSAHGTDTLPPVCISVKDAGPGIPPDEIPLLFGKFVRLKRDLSGTVRGTGLGLYISKHLIEAMSGHIWVESSGNTGEGSSFCFTLPSNGDRKIESSVFGTPEGHKPNKIHQR